MVMEYKVEQRVRLRRLKDEDAAAGMLRGQGRVVKVEPVRRDVPWLLRPYLISRGARLVKTHDACSFWAREGEGEREKERGRARNGVGIVKSGKLRGRAQSMSSNGDT